VVVIEHNLDVIKTADHLIDLGPRVAKRGRGGRHRHPRGVAAVAGSYTGRFLAELVEPAKPKRAARKQREAAVAA